MGSYLVFRRQWIEHEKLSYPIIRVPMMLALDPRALLRSKAFWIGFALVGVLDLINGLHVLYPSVPHVRMIDVVRLPDLLPERPWRDMGHASVSFYPFAIGMCYFIPLDLAFSCWFFWICFKLQRVLASHIGVHGMPGFPFVEEQAAGAYYAIALTAVWYARHHLRRLGAALFGYGYGDGDAFDRRDSRLAAGLLVTGGAFLAWFCRRAGMDSDVIALFFMLYFLMAVGVTRIRAELGPPTVDTYGMGAHLQVTRLFGASELGRRNPVNLVMFGLLSTLARTSRTPSDAARHRRAADRGAAETQSVSLPGRHGSCRCGGDSLHVLGHAVRLQQIRHERTDPGDSAMAG